MAGRDAGPASVRPSASARTSGAGTSGSRGRVGRAAAFAPMMTGVLAELVGVPLAQQQPDLVGLKQPGQAEEVLILRRGAELGAVVQHPVEMRRRLAAP